MGLYDTFVSKDDTVQVQLKAGRALMRVFREDNPIDPKEFQDAFYYGIEGVVVIRGGKVQSVTKEAPPQDPDNLLPSITKWGNPFSPEKGEKLETFHPLAALLLEEPES